MGKELKTLSRCSAPHANPSLNNSLLICNSSSHYLFFLFHPIVTCIPKINQAPILHLHWSSAKPNLSMKKIKNDSQIDVSLFSAYTDQRKSKPSSPISIEPEQTEIPMKKKMQIECSWIIFFPALWDLGLLEVQIIISSTCQRHSDRPKRPYWWLPYR